MFFWVTCKGVKRADWYYKISTLIEVKTHIMFALAGNGGSVALAPRQTFLYSSAPGRCREAGGRVRAANEGGPRRDPERRRRGARSPRGIYRSVMTAGAAMLSRRRPGGTHPPHLLGRARPLGSACPPPPPPSPAERSGGTLGAPSRPPRGAPPVPAPPRASLPCVAGGLRPGPG